MCGQRSLCMGSLCQCANGPNRACSRCNTLVFPPCSLLCCAGEEPDTKNIPQPKQAKKGARSNTSGSGSAANSRGRPAPRQAKKPAVVKAALQIDNDGDDDEDVYGDDNGDDNSSEDESEDGSEAASDVGQVEGKWRPENVAGAGVSLADEQAYLGAGHAVPVGSDGEEDQEDGEDQESGESAE